MSLRLRVLLAVGVIAAMVVTTAIVTTRIAREHLVDQVDTRLANAGPGRFGSPRPGDGNDADDDRPVRSEPYYVAVVVDGTLVTVAVPNLSGDESSPPDLGVDEVVARAASGSEPFTASDLDGDLEYRVLVRNDPRIGILVIGAPLDEVTATVSRISRVSWTIAFVVLAILALLAWWVLRLGVRPVQRMTAAAADIAEHDLTARVPVHAPRTEAGRLGTTLNAMLDRLERAFDERARTEARLRRFVGDASHELRTPVQTIRGYAELYRAGALGDPSKLDDAMRRTEAEAVRMAALVDELLTLARFDQARELRREPVDVGALVRDAAADASVIQPDRPVTSDIADDLVVAGDEHHLRQVLANLVSNALSHTPPSSALHLTARADGDAIVVAVRDEGPGMAPEVAERAFERFFRADAARTRAAGGTGLGLAIVQAVLEHHGGTVALDSSPERGTTVELRLPRQVTTPAPDPGPPTTTPGD